MGQAAHRILERAVEWNAAQRDDSFLLQKNDPPPRALARPGPNRERKPTSCDCHILNRASAAKRQRALAAVSTGPSSRWFWPRLPGFNVTKPYHRRTRCPATGCTGGSGDDERPALGTRCTARRGVAERYPTRSGPIPCGPQPLLRVPWVAPWNISAAGSHLARRQRLATASWDGTAGVGTWPLAGDLSLQPGRRTSASPPLRSVRMARCWRRQAAMESRRPGTPPSVASDPHDFISPR
jgi:hypothetical protein